MENPNRRVTPQTERFVERYTNPDYWESAPVATVAEREAVWQVLADLTALVSHLLEREVQTRTALQLATHLIQTVLQEQKAAKREDPWDVKVVPLRAGTETRICARCRAVMQKVSYDLTNASRTLVGTLRGYQCPNGHTVWSHVESPNDGTSEPSPLYEQHKRMKEAMNERG